AGREAPLRVLERRADRLHHAGHRRGQRRQPHRLDRPPPESRRHQGRDLRAPRRRGAAQRRRGHERAEPCGPGRAHAAHGARARDCRPQPHRRAGHRGLRDEVVSRHRRHRRRPVVGRGGHSRELAHRGGLCLARGRDCLPSAGAGRRQARGSALVDAGGRPRPGRPERLLRPRDLLQRRRCARGGGAAPGGAAMSAELLIGLALALPVFAAGLISVLGKAPNLREAVSLAAAAAVFLCVLSFSGEVLEGARPALRLVGIFPGLAVAFEIEPLGLLFALVASGLWFVSGIYSIGYMRGNGEAHQTRFFVCFALAIAAALGVAFAGNLLTLYLFYEALTFVTWPLVTHHGDAEAQKGGRTYLSLLLL